MTHQMKLGKKTKIYIELLGKENAELVLKAMVLPYINIDAVESYILQNQEQIKASQILMSIPLEVLNKPAEQTKLQSTPERKATDEDTPKRIEKSVVKVEANPFHQTLTDFLFTTEPKIISDPTAELQITIIKHIYKQAIVFQLIMHNTLDDVNLQGLQLELLNYQELSLTVDTITTLKEIPAGGSGTMYILLHKKLMFICGKMKGKLKYKICELDQTSKAEIGSYDETHIIEEIGLYLRDYVTADKVSFNFDSKWAEITKDEVAEHKQTFQLPYKAMEDAISNTIKYLGLIPTSGTDKLKEGAKKHMLLLNGKLITGQLVLVKVMIGFAAELGCVANVIAKCVDESVSEIVLKSIC